MAYHVKIHWPQSVFGYLFDLSKEKVEDRVVRSWTGGEPIVIKGRQFNAGRWMASIYESDDSLAMGRDVERWRYVVQRGHDVTDDFITTPFGSRGAVRGVSAETESSKGESPAPVSEAVDPRTVMVVHGRDLAVRDDIFNFLRALGLAPLEWAQLVSLSKEGTPYIGRVLQRAFEVAQSALVLFTPDDEVRLTKRLRTSDESDELEAQARPNVFFEAGLAFGQFPEKTILVELGNLRGASDLAGRHVLRFDGSAEKRHELAERLASAGCPVDRSGTDWLRVGKFSLQSERSSGAGA